MRHGIRIILMVLFAYGISESQHFYYTCSYADSVAPTQILFSKIDLDDKSFACSTTIPFEGEIILETPFKLTGNQQSFTLVLTSWGMWGKNSQNADSNSVNFAVLDSTCTIINSGIIDNTFIQRPDAYGSRWDSSFVYTRGRGVDEESYKGQLLLEQNRRPQLANSRRFQFDPSDYPQIDRFKYYRQISPDNRQLYWEVIDDGLYLLKLDVDRESILDTLRINDSTNRLCLFGFNESDSSINLFCLNYVIMAFTLPQFRKTSIDPSYVKKYSYSDFSLVDSIGISYPPLDSGYVMGNTTSIDKIGPYFVYFNLTPEDASYFNPAMLFIFDTRTNETTWLRVGWR